MCEKERKSRGGRREGGRVKLEVRGQHFLPPQDRHAAGATNNLWSQVWCTLIGQHGTQKKTLKCPMFTVSGASRLFYSQCSGSEASEVMREQCFLPQHDRHKPQFAFGIKGCPREYRHQRSRNWRNEDRGTPAGSKLRTLPICCPSGRRLRRPLDIKLFFTWSISQSHFFRRAWKGFF